MNDLRILCREQVTPHGCDDPRRRHGPLAAPERSEDRGGDRLDAPNFWESRSRTRSVPCLVVEAHLEYLRAGARVITTNSSFTQLWPFCINLRDLDGKVRVPWDLVKQNIDAAGRCACKARDNCLSKGGAERGRGARRGAGGFESPAASRLCERATDQREDGPQCRRCGPAVYHKIVQVIAPHCDLLLCETK